MALLFCESIFYRSAILLWLFVSFAAQMPDAPRFLSATAAISPPQVGHAKRDADMQTIFRGETAEGTHEPQSIVPSAQSPLTAKQKRKLLKSNFEKMKRDAGQLADLAKALQEELNKSNENVLSLEIVDKADKIEKLARKIKGTARGY